MAGIVVGLAEAVLSLSGLNNGLKLLTATGLFKDLDAYSKSFSVILDAIGATKTSAATKELKETLKGIADSMKNLEDELRGQVTAIEQMLVNQAFMSGEVLEASTMLELIKDILEDPVEETRKDGIDELNNLTKTKSPKYLATKFIQSLKTDSLNPLRVAMRSENPRKQETFSKWENIFISVLTQFIGVEYWRLGLQSGGDQKFKVPIAMLKKNIAFREEFLDKWRLEYQESNWETQVLPTIKTIKDRLGRNNKAQIANEILNSIRGWVSDGHHYWVIVYNGAGPGSNDKHSFEPQPSAQKNESKTNQTAFSFDPSPSGVNVVVHRSKEWKKQSGEKLQKITGQLSELSRTNPLPRGQQLDLAMLPKKFLRDFFNGVLEVPFFATIDARLDVVIRGTSHLGGTVPGPGAVGTVSTLGRLNSSGGAGDVRITIVVGFK